MTDGAITVHYAWNVEGIYKADAEKVHDEIENLGDNAFPENILEKARNPETELHKCFDWEDTVAAEKWRLHQARNITRNIIFVRNDESTEPKEITHVRAFYKPSATEPYKPTPIILQHIDEYQRLLESCRRDLEILKKKYHTLSEYDAIWELIN